MPLWLDVGARFLRLGLSAFGGPVAHLGYFRREFVERARWLSDAEFAEIVALCTILPGPTSSQVGMTLGFRRAGFVGAFVAWLAFTLPSAILMTGFGLLLRSPLRQASPGASAALAGAFDGLAGVAAAVVVVAVFGLARNLAATRLARCIAAGALVTALVCERASPALTWLPLLAGGIAGALFGGSSALRAETLRFRIPRATAFAAAGAFALLLTGLPLLASKGTWLASFATFFRAGALVFGGGHVVLPFLDGAIARGSISARDFFAGYGVAQAVPGPLFTFAAFLGAFESKDAPFVGALVAILGIFSPSFLLLTAALPMWNAVRDVPRARAVLDGFGAAVVGLLAAVLVDPIGSSLIHQPRSLIVAGAALPLLSVARMPAWAVVALGAAAGVLLPGGRANVGRGTFLGNDENMLDGSRTFELAWGAIAGTICFTLGTIVILRWLAARRSGAPSLFGRAIDPHRRLQLAYGIFAMAMGGTNYGCRFIDHRYLEGVHEGFAAISLVVVVLLVSLLLNRRTALT